MLSRILVLFGVRLKITQVNSIPQFDFQFPKLKNQHGGHADFFVVPALMPSIGNLRWKNYWKYGGLCTAIFTLVKFCVVKTETYLQISYEAFFFFLVEITHLLTPEEGKQRDESTSGVCTVSSRSLHPHLCSNGVNLELRKLCIDVCLSADHSGRAV
jgi:hypothetical protein